MKILVTGGAGFIGSNFIHFLLKKYSNVSVVNFDKLTYAGNLENLSDVARDRRYKFIRGDIADEKFLSQTLVTERPDAIVNFAAETHVDRSILDPKTFLATNILGTENLLQAVKRYQIAKMVQISTDEVFGSIHDGEFHETSPFQPNSPYSASKASADLLCHAYFKTYATPVMTVHACNCFGPYQYPEKFVPLFITNLMEGKKVPIYGDGKQVREWIYAEDFCSAVDAVLNNGKAGQSYNIGSGHRESNIETTRKILKLMDKDDSHIEFVKDRPGHDLRYALNSEKIRIELSWKPAYSFDAALAETVSWYKNNHTWWSKIKSGEYLNYYERQYGNRKIV